jgi:hypothetical protein
MASGASGSAELTFAPLTCGYLKTRTGGAARHRASLWAGIGERRTQPIGV